MEEEIKRRPWKYFVESKIGINGKKYHKINRELLKAYKLGLIHYAKSLLQKLLDLDESKNNLMTLSILLEVL